MTRQREEHERMRARIAELEDMVAHEEETSARLRIEIRERDAEIADLIARESAWTPAYEKVRDRVAVLQAESDQLQREVQAAQEDA